MARKYNVALSSPVLNLLVEHKAQESSVPDFLAMLSHFIWCIPSHHLFSYGRFFFSDISFFHESVSCTLITCFSILETSKINFSIIFSNVFWVIYGFVADSPQMILMNNFFHHSSSKSLGDCCFLHLEDILVDFFFSSCL